MHCKTCAHWGNNRGYNEDADKRLKSCDCPKFFYGYHSYNDTPDDGAFIEDDEGWGMMVGPEFGCVNWEQKS